MIPRLETKDHISVCICTFKRPLYLKNLLSKLENQKTSESFGYSVVVVDNDHLKTAEATVLDFKNASPLPVYYHNEPVQNISHARNKAVNMAAGNLVAFIDDDEFPVEDWLFNLYAAYVTYKGDGILGPVVPFYEENTPRWLVKSRICERRTHPTGTPVGRKDVRTGNVLMNKNVFSKPNVRFDPKFGLSGGEDTAFFEELIGQKKVFIWCNEAVVYEFIPPERWRKSFYIKKLIRSGGLDGEKDSNSPKKYRLIIRSFAALVFYLCLLPFFVLAGIRGVMRGILKLSYYYGWFTGFFDKPVLRFREEVNVNKF